jgi:repressor LexA
MDYKALSDRQKNILAFIQAHQAESGFPPTIREIGVACDIPSTSVVNYNLNKLVEGGFIIRTPDKSRGIRLNTEFAKEVPVLFDNRFVISVPHVGKIVASAPVWPGDGGYYYDKEDMIEIPRSIVGNGVESTQIYALTVSGHSMIDAMIDDGDVVILKRQETARNGDMVAAWLTEKNETTLKHFYDEGHRVRLQPRNPTMAPFYVEKGKVQIQGKVLAVLRKVN